MISSFLLASMKDVKATGEASKSKPSNENIQPSKQLISSLFFSFLMGHFCPPGSGTAFPMQIRIQPTKINADP
jgi:hypothetical protein